MTFTAPVDALSPGTPLSMSDKLSPLKSPATESRQRCSNDSHVGWNTERRTRALMETLPEAFKSNLADASGHSFRPRTRRRCQSLVVCKPEVSRVTSRRDSFARSASTSVPNRGIDSFTPSNTSACSLKTSNSNSSPTWSARKGSPMVSSHPPGRSTRSISHIAAGTSRM